MEIRDKRTDSKASDLSYLNSGTPFVFRDNRECPQCGESPGIFLSDTTNIGGTCVSCGHQHKWESMARILPINAHIVIEDLIPRITPTK